MLTLFGQALYTYLIIFGLIKMLSGKYDRIIEENQENTYSYPDNEVKVIDYNFMPMVAIDIDDTEP